jgi:hypothetical protein
MGRSVFMQAAWVIALTLTVERSLRLVTSSEGEGGAITLPGRLTITGSFTSSTPLRASSPTHPDLRIQAAGKHASFTLEDKHLDGDLVLLLSVQVGGAIVGTGQQARANI